MLRIWGLKGLIYNSVAELRLKEPMQRKNTWDWLLGKYRVIQDKFFSSDFDKFNSSLPFDDDKNWKPKGDEVISNHPILCLLVYVWCEKIDNRNDRVKETRQESENILVLLSMVFKKLGLIANEFLLVLLPVINTCLPQNASNSYSLFGRILRGFPAALPFPPLFIRFARCLLVRRSCLYTCSIWACVRNFEYSL